MKKFDAATKLQENEFYGSEALLNMFQQMPKMGTTPNKSSVNAYLNSAYTECNTHSKLQLFYSIVFSIGDISNRVHNFFKQEGLKNVENGGSSLRKTFLYSLEWMLTKNKETQNQFYEYLPLISEYTNTKNSFFYELKTDRKKGNVIEVSKLPVDVDKVTTYIAEVLKSPKTTDATRTLWAKFIPYPSNSDRKRKIVILEGKEEYMSKKLGYKVKAGDVISKKSPLQGATIERENFFFNFVFLLSKKMDWEIIQFETHKRFKGFTDFKKTHLFETEARLFSQKGILDYTKDQFASWLDKQPSGARYRVQRRLFNLVDGKTFSTRKWITKIGEDLADWFTSWEKQKTVAQERLLSLTDEDKANMSKTDLKKLEKAAKVNTAGDTLVKALSQIKQGNITTEQAKLVSQSILNKIVCKVPVFMWVDVSGSMSSSSVTIEGVKFTARELSAIALTAFMMLNPLKELGNIFGIFSTNSNIVTDYSFNKKNKSQNQWMHAENTHVKDSLLINHTKSFYENYLHIYSVISGYDFASTNISSISTDLRKWVESDQNLKSSRIEMILQYPVHLYISDGDFNNGNNSNSSLMQHRSNMKQWFGWDGVVVIWDVKHESYNDGQKFECVPNTMYFGSDNPGVLTQIFENIHDLDIVDTYLPLLALSRTTRYAPVRSLTLNPKTKTSEHSVNHRK